MEAETELMQKLSENKHIRDCGETKATEDIKKAKSSTSIDEEEAQLIISAITQLSNNYTHAPALSNTICSKIKSTKIDINNNNTNSESAESKTKKRKLEEIGANSTASKVTKEDTRDLLSLAVLALNQHTQSKSLDQPSELSHIQSNETISKPNRYIKFQIEDENIIAVKECHIDKVKMIAHRSVCNKKYKCYMCFEFASNCEASFQSHLRKHHLDEIECEFCDTKFAYLSDYNLHECSRVRSMNLNGHRCNDSGSLSNRYFICMLCYSNQKRQRASSYFYTNYDSYRKHLFLKHNQNLEIKCSLCVQESPTIFIKNYVHHLRNEHEISNLKCTCAQCNT